MFSRIFGWLCVPVFTTTVDYGDEMRCLQRSLHGLSPGAVDRYGDRCRVRRDDCFRARRWHALAAACRPYLHTPGGGTELPAVAAGFQRLAVLARLIASGRLGENSYLFWDEPAANLNPKLIRELARALLYLCQNGVQVFITTHSLFLMRELDILLRQSAYVQTSRQFFGLHRVADVVVVTQGDSVDDIGAIASLGAELEQSDRYLALS